MASQYTAFQRRSLCNPHAWVAKGKQILFAAGEIKPRVDEYWATKPHDTNLHGHIDVFMMLCSYSLENLLKGLIILREGTEIEQRLNNSESFNAIVPEQHDLCRLAKRAGLINLASGKRALLERLTRSAVWAARYPAPLRPSGYDTDDPFGMAGKGWATNNTYMSKDADDIMGVAQLILAELNNIGGQQTRKADA